jgi:outer membrane protein TolC
MACVLAAGALGCSALAQPAPALSLSPVHAADVAAAPLPNMAQALDAAWARSLESVESRSRQKLAQAQQRVASTWLAGPPTLELSQREGQGSAAEGSRETDVGLALPLWRFGQRQQNVEAADAESAWAGAAEQVARLRLAAQVREQASRLRLAEVEVQQAARQRQLIEKLSNDVERRVKAGDLAPADALAARADMLAARAQEKEAQQAHAVQRSAWALLTGLAVAPQPEELKATGAAALDEHIEVRLADAALQRARHRLAQAQAERGAPPELGIGLRQERPGLGQPRQSSVALSLRVPFGTQAHNQPRLAAALAEEDMALATQQRLHRQLEAELDLARGHLATSQAQAEAEQERAALLSERAQLLQKSFQAGESSLPELLRAMAAAAQASSASARQQAGLAQAQARVQQALGQLP